MQTIISERGQTAVPAQVRQRFGLKTGQKLQWITENEVIYVVPVAAETIKSFRGSSSTRGLNAALLKSRQIDG
ncbi:MAG TPA: AbrB/MazE/SpoVT family DNA-binding domain-containing protein [Candidatus Saccharimonadales bacterium]|jgi:AbrB family looped-hinge helix DNA binding protein